MASKETLLVPQEELDKGLVNLKKKGENYVKAYLVRSGADSVWVDSLNKDELFHHALVLKGVLKERLPFKKAVEPREAQKEATGGTMEMFMQFMKSLEAERKAEEARRKAEEVRRETERKDKEARRKAEEVRRETEKREKMKRLGGKQKGILK